MAVRYRKRNEGRGAKIQYLISKPLTGKAKCRDTNRQGDTEYMDNDLRKTHPSKTVTVNQAKRKRYEQSL